jgi:hypothetical protein
LRTSIHEENDDLDELIVEFAKKDPDLPRIIDAFMDPRLSTLVKYAAVVGKQVRLTV